MVFNSLTFLVFLAVVLAVHRAPIGWTARKANLLVASYIFYGAWNPPFVLLLVLSTVIDWYVARGIARSERVGVRRALLLLSLTTNLGLLGFFKYGEFLLRNFVALAATVGVDYHPPELGIVLPVGISFYTFQTLSYTIDVYRGSLRPWRSFLEFALYVSFFPQLVAGPIVRASEFLPQFLEPAEPTRDQVAWGFTLLVIGMFSKVILADALLAPVADGVYSSHGAGFVDAWIGTLAFSGQIFYDFSGYSTCAIGVALVLGFSLPDNFRYPYGSIGFSEFWRRWHISLSGWLRDYLYISLGGNRRGQLRTHVNLAMTMLLGGLWHGASWRFVVWGGLHGLYLIAERLLRDRWGGHAWLTRGYVQWLLMLGTYLLVCLTWVFFRATDFDAAFELVTAMTTGRTAPIATATARLLLVLAVTLWILASHRYMRRRTLEETWGKLPAWVQSSLLATLLLALIFAPGEERAFIYFQF